MAGAVKDALTGIYGGIKKKVEDYVVNAPMAGGPTKGKLRTRLSVRELEKPENAFKLNAFLRAWKRIKDLPPSNPNSFWSIAGYHGEPFKPRNIPLGENVTSWGGWCQHANVLFPTWHRFYTLRIEQALQAVCPEDDITMAYWDQTSEESLKEGIPKTLTDDTVVIDGQRVPNPLKSFKLPKEIKAFDADKFYNKPEGYETVRYPFSGIKSPPQAKQVADKHNAEMEKLFPATPIKGEKGSPVKTAVDVLNDNILEWLTQGVPNRSAANGVLGQYKSCLLVPNYNSFSNTESASHTGEVSLETPHNSIHLAIGGYDMGGVNYGQIEGSNGDMAENETASFDPIFFFHHCNIDRIFWVWQKKYDKTDSFEIDQRDKWGTNTSTTGGQGPTPSQGTNEQLTMDTLLAPFQNEYGLPVTSRDCINIQKQLGYTYSIGSLDEWTESTDEPPVYLKVSNIDKDLYPGSFLVRAYYKDKEKNKNEKVFIGQYPVLTRWNRADCKNCQYHLLVCALFDLTDVPDIEMRKSPNDYVLEIVSRNPFSGKRKIETLTIKDEPGDNDPQVDFFNI